MLANLPTVLGLAAFIVLAKALLTLLAVLPFRLGTRTTAFASLGLMQIGEFSYLLAQTGRSVGAISEELNSLILTSSVVTIILTPFGFRLAPSFGRLLDRLPGLGGRLGAPAFALDDQPALMDHSVVIGYGRVGSAVADRLMRAGVPVAVVDEDLHLVQQLRTAGVPAVYGDAVYPSVLQAAHPERAHLIVVALPDAGTTRGLLQEMRRVNPTTSPEGRASARRTKFSTRERTSAPAVAKVVGPSGFYP